MLTPTQKRAMRAKALLDSGMDVREAARECGYKNVNGMMGAIALCLRKLPEADQQAEMERMQEAETQKCTQCETACTDDFTTPGVYELDGEEVLVGEKIPQNKPVHKADHKENRRQWREKVQARLAERRDDVKTETKRVICTYAKNEITGAMEFKIHVCGIDRWIVLDEEILGGREALMRLMGDMIAGIGYIMEGMA